MIGNLLGGRGKCKFCGEYHNNISYHEAHECNNINKMPTFNREIHTTKCPNCKCFSFNVVWDNTEKHFKCSICGFEYPKLQYQYELPTNIKK